MGKALTRLLDRFSGAPSSAAIAELLQQNDTGYTVTAYQKAVSVVEQAMWSGEFDPSLLELYQEIFRELEGVIASRGNDSRHEFIIVIPVADRPQHLRSCLESLLELCRTFGYGGRDESGYRKVSVLIADDSREPERIAQNRQITDSFNRRGLRTIYFGQAEQLEQIDRFDPAERAQLSEIIGDIDPEAFYHKGASIMRNITYLKLNEMKRDDASQLFYFIDSDQEFKIKIDTGEGDRDLFAINYLYWLDHIFSTTDTSILTGKVVGDPPVSPSVMAGNFLEDIIGLLQQLDAEEPDSPCRFHNNSTHTNDDASYHDMAELFGFKPSSSPLDYRCTLTGEHNHKACLNGFAEKLGQFFDGEHPTRKTCYEPEKLLKSIKPARTIYTGNYIFRPVRLDSFIPFAPLKLRMAGPTLGRIIKAQIGDDFASANLPMLHKRTVDEIGESEFRPGISREEKRVDLSGEFERQFFGDVMLFSMEKLTGSGFPDSAISADSIRETVHPTAEEMYSRYMKKQSLLLEKLQRLYALLNDGGTWWNSEPELESARSRFKHFLISIEHNFGTDAPGYQLIAPGEHRQQRLREITEAIVRYPRDKAAWKAALTAN